MVKQGTLAVTMSRDINWWSSDIRYPKLKKKKKKRLLHSIKKTGTCNGWEWSYCCYLMFINMWHDGVVCMWIIKYQEQVGRSYGLHILLTGKQRKTKDLWDQKLEDPVALLYVFVSFSLYPMTILILHTRCLCKC